MPLFQQTLKGPQQRSDVMKVQARGGLVKNQQPLTALVVPHVERQLEPLRLAAGQGVERLPEAHVVQAHVLQGLQPAAEGCRVVEKGHRLCHSQLQDVSDGTALVRHFQYLAAKTRPVAVRAGDEDVRQELHVDFLEAAPLTCFAASPCGVEGERAGAQTALVGRRSAGEQAPNMVPHLDIRGRVGSRGTPHGCLINQGDGIQGFAAGQFAAGPGSPDRHAPGFLQPVVQHLVHQGALARPRHTSNAHEYS